MMAEARSTEGLALRFELVAFGMEKQCIWDATERLTAADVRSIVGLSADACSLDAGVNLDPDDDFYAEDAEALDLIARCRAWLDSDRLNTARLTRRCSDLSLATVVGLGLRPVDGSPRMCMVTLDLRADLTRIGRGQGVAMVDFIGGLSSVLGPSSGGSWLQDLASGYVGPPLLAVRDDNRLRFESGPGLTHYGWISVLPDSLLCKLGGSERVREHPLVEYSKPFSSGESGGLVLLAATSPLRMTGERLAQWREFLDPVMPPLVPSRWGRPIEPVPHGIAQQDLRWFASPSEG